MLSASAVSGLDLRSTLGHAVGLLLLCSGVLLSGCGNSESAAPSVGDGAPPTPSAEAVLARMGDSSPEVRASAARAAESLHDSAAVGIALANLTKSDPEPRVRLRALESSREFAGPEVDEALVKALADMARAAWAEAGVKARAIETPESYTGAAYIFVEEATGNNAIIVCPGAAGLIGPADIDANRGLIQSAGVFVTQLEQPVGAAMRGLEIARAAKVA